MKRNKSLSPANAVNAARVWMKVDTLRKIRGLSWTQVSVDTGIPLSTLNSAKNNKKTPQLPMCVVLSSYFCVSLDYLVNGNAYEDGSERAMKLLSGPCSQMTKKQIQLLTDMARFIVDANVCSV